MDFKRLFTRSEAERALPLVKRIVADILDTGRRIRETEEDDGSLPGLKADLEENLHELESIGCYFKDWDFSIGLVDFPAEVEGETVFLCWRSDESSLGWYHGIDDGYRGRRPLPAHSVTE